MCVLKIGKWVCACERNLTLLSVVVIILHTKKPAKGKKGEIINLKSEFHLSNTLLL